MSRLLVQILSGSLLLFAMTICNAEDDSAVLSIAEISAVPRAVRSCEFEYLSFNGDRRKVAVDGEKFFVRVAGRKAGFDGRWYWVQNPLRIERSSFLGFKQLDTHPLNAPYLWAWGDPSIAMWSDLAKNEIWDEVKQRMTYLESREVREQTCDVYLVDYPERSKRYVVAFSRELRGFPIQISFEYGGKHFSTVDVLETHQVGPSAIVAVKGQAERVGRDPIPWMQVELDSIKVNQPVEEALFRPQLRRQRPAG